MKENKKNRSAAVSKSPTVSELLNGRSSADASKPSDASYLTMVLLTMLLPFGVARVYIGYPDGKIRVATFLGALGVVVLVTVLSLLFSIFGIEDGVADFIVGIPLLVAILVLIASFLRSVIDFTTVLGQRTDYQGRVLGTSPREDRWARVIFYSVLAALLLLVVLYLLNLIDQAVYIRRNGLFPGA